MKKKRKIFSTLLKFVNCTADGVEFVGIIAAVIGIIATAYCDKPVYILAMQSEEVHQRDQGCGIQGNSILLRICISLLTIYQSIFTLQTIHTETRCDAHDMRGAGFTRYHDMTHPLQTSKPPNLIWLLCYHCFHIFFFFCASLRNISQSMHLEKYHCWLIVNNQLRNFLVLGLFQFYIIIYLFFNLCLHTGIYSLIQYM